MPCPHNEISIVQRSQQQSAVAAAAYQSGEKLFCGYDQEVKHYPEKRGIVHNEILLPANAPRSYADRNTLWNAAEAVEKQWNSQLARRWVLTIPREIPPDQYAALVRDFCNQQFVSKGMCVDFAIHDKGDGSVTTGEEALRAGKALSSRQRAEKDSAFKARGKRAAMMNFTNDEMNLMCIYQSDSRSGLIAALTEMRGYLDEDEAELRALTDSALQKLGEITDEDFAALELVPDFDKDE